MKAGRLMPETIQLPLLRTSERKDFKRCPLRWWWAWRDGLKPRGPEDMNLWFGTGIHLAFAHWYIPGLKRGIDPRETFEKFVKDETRQMKLTYKDEFGQWEKDFVDAGQLGEHMLDEYLKWYGWDDHWEFIEPEQRFAVVLNHPTLGKVVKFVGTFDGVMRNHEEDRIELLETKTAKSISISHLALDDQAGGYHAVATQALRASGVIGKREVIDGICYNYLRKAKADDRPQNAAGEYLNKDGSVSKNQPKPMFERPYIEKTRLECNKQLKSIMAERTAMARFESGEQEMYKNPNWNCHWDCQFFGMCELEQSTPDWKEFRDRMFVKRDPYADHRKSASE
jgi:hypothetical protein